MQSNSLPAKTIEWMRLHLTHGMVKYVVAVLIALLILVSSVAYMVRSTTTQTAANVATEQEHEEQELPPEPVTTKTEDVKTDLQATITTDSPAENTQLKVNNTPVTVPANGTVHETVQGDGGNTSLNVTVNSTTNGSASNDSSTSIQLNTKSETETEFEFESSE